MAYSEFTSLAQAIDAFTLEVAEGREIIVPQTVEPTAFLTEALARELDWAIAVGTEQSRREALTHNLLLEVREQTQRQVAVFSGKEFNVDPSAGLNGYCDYLISLSSIQSVIMAPVAIITEAKKGDLDLGVGQCVAGMVAAQQYNQNHGKPLSAVYGSVTSGTLWKFVKLHQQQLTIDLMEYPVPPVHQVLGMLMTIVHAVSSLPYPSGIPSPIAR